MLTTMTPDLDAVRERNLRLFTQHSAGFEARDIDACLALWDPDGAYSVAYPVEGFPAEVRGHDGLRAVLGGFLASVASLEQRDLRFHQTTDPDVFLVEWEWHAVLHDGTTAANRYVGRARVRGGRFAEFHEYYGELAHRALLTRLGFIEA
jgi:ketosteroid isomerase-like protein